MGLVLDSNALDFADLQSHVHGRGDQEWTAAIDEVALTWQM